MRLRDAMIEIGTLFDGLSTVPLPERTREKVNELKPIVEMFLSRTGQRMIDDGIADVGSWLLQDEAMPVRLVAHMVFQLPTIVTPEEREERTARFVNALSLLGLEVSSHGTVDIDGTEVRLSNWTFHWADDE